MRLEITLGTVCARGYLCKSLSLNDLHKRGPQRKPLTDKGLRWSFFLDKEKNGSVSMGSQRTRCKISLHTMLPFTYVTNQQKSNKNKISLDNSIFPEWPPTRLIIHTGITGFPSSESNRNSLVGHDRLRWTKNLVDRFVSIFAGVRYHLKRCKVFFEHIF